jgi:two-component system cell cycle response regulator DivK
MSRQVLIVEDQDDLRDILRLALEGAGYTVFEAANGRQGVEMVAAKRPDLVLMDIQMPVLDGYDATREIKASPDLSQTPVIAISSYAMKGDEEKARAAGCDDYVTKPYSPRALLAKVRQHLDGKEK